jgi:signal transduction histidine kinase
MQQRLFRSYVFAIIPWVLILGVVTNLWIQDARQSPASNFLWTKSTSVSFGIQAIVGLTATLVILVSFIFAKRVVKPFDTLLEQVNLIRSQGSNLVPQLTGITEIDKSLSELFTQANAAQRRLDSERTLAADVSHQLRSPLTALSLRLEQIVKETSGTKAQEDAKAAIGQVDRLVKLVEGLLTTWRTTSDRDLTPIHVSTFLTRVMQHWQSQLVASRRTIELNCDGSLVALGTMEIQEQVMSVLIENAIQHGSGKITISAKDYQSWILVEVSDEGPGISGEIESSLMAKGTTTSGIGLGLAWARNQVAADGGRLELRSLKPAIFGVFLIADNAMNLEAG